MAQQLPADDACAMAGIASQPEEAHRAAGFLRAPADRAAGERGLRAPLAGLVALATLFPFSVANFEVVHPAWARPAFVLAAAAGIVAAVLLWVARRRVVLALAIGLTLLGLLSTVAAERARQRVVSEEEKWGGSTFSYENRGRRLTRAQAEAVPKGLTRAQLTARLGVPSARGIERVVGEDDLRCLGYRSAARLPKHSVPNLHAFCFRDGRYAVLRSW